MLGTCYQDDPEYASSRLKNTIVFKDKEPIYITAIGGAGEVRYYNLGSHSRREFLTTLQQIDLTPNPLGYVNTEWKAHYLRRWPYRQFKQGLTWDSIKKADLKGPDLARCLKNIYPSVTACVDEIYNREVFSRAFSRKMCLSTDSSRKSERPTIKVLFKDHPIGIFNLDTGTFDLKTFFMKFMDEFEGVKGVPDIRYF